MRKTWSVALALAGMAAAAAAQQPAGYHVLRRLAVGGEGGWDYITVDAAARRLYVTHGTHVVVLNADSGTVVGDIANTPGVHGVAIAAGLGRGFISDGRDSTVTIFDLKTLAVLGRPHVTGANPDAILFNAPTGKVFAFNGRTANATVLDAATGAVRGTIALDGKPEFAVTLDSAVYVNIEDRSELLRIDPKAETAPAHGLSLAPCEEPSGLAVDADHKRLFAVCGNKLLAVVDPVANRLVTTVPIGAGVDAAAFDPSSQLVFASNGEGTLTVIHEDDPNHYTVVETVPTQRSARTCALDATTHRLFLPAAEFGPAPAPTVDQPRPRPSMMPGSFTVLVVGR